MGAAVTTPPVEEKDDDEGEAVFVHRTINTKALANVFAILSFALGNSEDLHCALLRFLLKEIRSLVSGTPSPAFLSLSTNILSFVQYY